MTPAADSFWDTLSQDEADFAQTILPELANQPWAQPIVAVLRRQRRHASAEREGEDHHHEDLAPADPLVPLGEARLGRIGFDEWLRRSQAGAQVRN
jgi:hypothetical protein